MLYIILLVPSGSALDQGYSSAPDREGGPHVRQSFHTSRAAVLGSIGYLRALYRQASFLCYLGQQITLVVIGCRRRSDDAKDFHCGPSRAPNGLDWDTAVSSSDYTSMKFRDFLHHQISLYPHDHYKITYDDH
jgi:hypothetical protein